MSEFRTVINGKSVDVLLNIDVEPYDFVVTWACETEEREYGIKEIISYIISVKGTIAMLNDIDEIIAEVEIAAGSACDEFKIVDEMKMKEGGSLYPTEILIDFDNKLVEVR